MFDGGAGHYQELPGQFSSDVRYDSDLKPAFSDTQLVLLTLNAALSKSNPSTSVLLNFYDGKQDEMASVTTSFFCWEQVKLSPSPGLTSNFLSKNLTAAHAASLGAMSAEGVVTSGQASQPIPGAVVNVTLLALVETTSGGSAPGPQKTARSNIYRTFNNPQPIPATFSALSP